MSVSLRLRGSGCAPSRTASVVPLDTPNVDAAAHHPERPPDAADDDAAAQLLAADAAALAKCVIPLASPASRLKAKPDHWVFKVCRDVA